MKEPKEQKPKQKEEAKQKKTPKSQEKASQNTKKQEQTKENKKQSEKKKEVKQEANKKDPKQEQEKNPKKETENKKFEKIEKQSKKVYKDMTAKEYRRRKVILPITIAILVIAIATFSTIFAIINMGSQKINSGISIAEIEVSGLTIEESYQSKKEKEIAIQYQDYETTINPSLIEVNYQIEKAVEEAFLIGRKDNLFINNYQILKTLIQKKDIEVEMTLNEDIAKQTIEDIGVNLPGVIIESSHAIEEDELIITKGKEGIIIDTEKLLEQLKQNLQNRESKEDYLAIPVKQKEPEPIDIDKIHEEVYTEAKDAYYTKDPFTIYPEVEGIDFDVEAAKEQLKEEKEEYIIKLTITKPKITIDKIGPEAFPDEVGTFTTRYDVTDVDRSANLVLACQKINGKVILAGETFSYNKALGPRTAAAGYRNGKIYSGGEVVDGIGGGICQISSTLYNTVLTANLEIVERRNHQFVTSYVPAGRDATVVYGMTDFKFKNTRKYPVRIVATAKNGIATVSMYGIKEENEYTFTFTTKNIASIPFATKYEEDPTLPAGTEKIKQKGANGLKTETYINKILNGKVISTTLLSKDTYDAMSRIIIKGTNGELVTPEPPVTEETNTTPEEQAPNQTEPMPNNPSQDANTTQLPQEKPVV